MTAKLLIQRLRNLSVWICRALGTEITDCRTGEALGRGLLLTWRGRIHLIGLDHSVVAVPLPQARITYWKQEIGFTRHPAPDFPRSESARSLLSHASSTRDRVLLVYMDHRAKTAVEAGLKRWEEHGVALSDICLAYGGPAEDCLAINHPRIVFLQGERHKTRDHTREWQSYRELFDLVAEILRNDRSFTHVFFVEYDQIPIAPSVADRYLHRMRDLDADLLGYALGRIDGTTHPHFLVLRNPPGAIPVLSMLGTGHFWKREAWLAVSDDKTFADWYLELDLPTTALKLGFRICGLPDQDMFVTNLPERLPCDQAAAGQLGAWTLHPVKHPECTRSSGA